MATIRLFHEDNGYTHAYSKQELKSLLDNGWVVINEPESAELAKPVEVIKNAETVKIIQPVDKTSEAKTHAPIHKAISANRISIKK